MIDELQRLPSWERNDGLEKLLKRLAGYLGSASLKEHQDEVPPSPNVLFICGVGRAGTTLLLQYLVASGVFAYPSNLISRFYMAPYVGELVQQMLLNEKFNYGDQFADLRSGIKPISFDSRLGKTSSTLEPNEFWYFWRRFFDFESGTRYTARDVNSDASRRFRQELAHWEWAAGKPLVMKAATASWNIAGLVELLPKARFVIMRRDPADLMISLLNARFRFWGNIEGWYGLVMPQDIGILSSDPCEQVALQVAAFDVLLPAQIQGIPAEICHIVDYQKFCISPGTLWKHEIMTPYKPVPDQLTAHNRGDYHSLRFEPSRAVPDENSPHMNISRAHLLALYDQFVRELKTKR